MNEEKSEASLDKSSKYMIGFYEGIEEAITNIKQTAVERKIDSLEEMTQLIDEIEEEYLGKS